MPSIRCSQCNLVNFSTETHCKRCQNPLSDFAPITEQRTYQTNYEQNYGAQPAYGQQNPFQNQPAQYNSYQSPNSYGNQYQTPQWTGNSCMKCGTGSNVSVQSFKKEYVPPLSYLALLIGLIPGALLILLMKTRHQLHAPFCGACWSKFKNVGTVETLSALGFFFGFIVALFFGVGLESFVVFFILFALTCGVLYLGISYSRKHNLKFKKVNGSQVIVTDPLNGDVRLVG